MTAAMLHGDHGPDRARVLVVDDDPMVQALVAGILVGEGFEVLEAGSVAAARERLRGAEVDLVLLDILLPDASGLELCTWLRGQARLSYLPVIVLTGSDEDRLIHDAFDAGATDFLRKPIEAPILAHRIRFAIRASRTAMSLHASRASLAEAQTIARVGSFELDVDRGTLDLSEQVAEMLGFGDRRRCTLQELLARVHSDDLARTSQQLDDAMADVSARRFATVHRLREGLSRTRWVQIRAIIDRWPDGAARCIRGTTQDVTESRRQEQAIEYLATHDQVSGLLNRDGFERVAAGAIGHARRRGERVAIVYIALARGAPLRAQLGADRTGQLLRQAGERLAGASVQRGCTEEPLWPMAVARWDSSSFALLFSDLEAPERAVDLARTAVESLAPPFELGERRIGLLAQAGVAVHPDDGRRVEDLVRHAEVAMRSLEPTGRSGVRRYEHSMRMEWELRLELEHDLLLAINAGHLQLHFQPQVAPDGAIVAAEALLRWTHPVHGAIPPDCFIPLAEETGLIDTLGRWVIDEAIAELARWHRGGATHLHVGINVSVAQLGDAGLGDTLLAALRRHDVPAGAVELELTESVLLGDGDEVRATIDALRSTGVGLSLDDVGTGYASLSVLSSLPLDQLKIDRTFVWRLEQPQTLAVVRALIALGHGLGMTLVAEGVETEEQARLLIAEGCDVLQGYHYGRPMDAVAFRSAIGLDVLV